MPSLKNQKINYEPFYEMNPKSMQPSHPIRSNRVTKKAALDAIMDKVKPPEKKIKPKEIIKVVKENRTSSMLL